MSGGIPYLGSKISLISKSEIRYEGILYTIDTKESTVALAKVRSFGTEERHTERPVAPRDEIYEYIIFRASDIKDLHVCEAPTQTLSGLPNDPAIVQHSAPLPSSSFSPTSSSGSFGPIGAIPSQPYSSPQASLPNIPQPFVTPDSQHSDSRSETPSNTPQQSKSPILDANITGIISSSRIEAKENKPPMSQRSSNKTSSQQLTSSNSSQRRQPPSSGQRLRQQQPQELQRSPMRGGSGGGGVAYGNRGRNQGRNRHNFQGRSKILQFEGEYDFEQANAEFQELEGKLSKIKLDSPTPSSVIEPEEKKEDQNFPDNESADTLTTDDDDYNVYYDRQKSFFDNISCEAVERSKGNMQRHDWRQERKLNVETFGVSGSNSWRRNGWRGGRGFRSRGFRSGGRGYGFRGHRSSGSGDRNVPHSNAQSSLNR